MKTYFNLYKSILFAAFLLLAAGSQAQTVTYLWSNGATTPNIVVNPQETTTYYLTITQDGVEYFDSLVVTVTPPPLVAINGSSSVCLGFSTTLQASPGVTYLWSTGETTASITVSPSENTSYSVEITDAAGCTGTAEINVIVNQPSTATETVSACGSYTWNGNTYTQGGTYDWTGTNLAGCDSVVTLNLIINQPSAETVNATITEGETYSFNGQSLTTAGTYTATLQNAAGCDSVVTLNLSVEPIQNPCAGNGEFTEYQILQRTNGENFRQYADINGDGLIDLITQDNSAVARFYINTGSGFIAAGSLQLPPFGNVVAAKDFDNDGRVDLLSNSITGTNCLSNQIRIFWNTGTNNAFFNSALSTNLPLPVNPYCVQSQDIDFNGDGLLDIIATSMPFSPSTNSPGRTYLNNGNRNFTVAADFLWPRDLYGTHTRDFNGDGNADFLVTVKDGWADGLRGMYYYRGNGNGTFQAPVINFNSAPLAAGGIPIQADPLNNNTEDVLMSLNGVSPSTIKLGRWNGVNNFAFNDISIPSGFATSQAYDFDLDGKQDIMILSSNGNNTLRWMAGNGDGTFTANPTNVLQTSSFNLSTLFNDLNPGTQYISGSNANQLIVYKRSASQVSLVTENVTACSSYIWNGNTYTQSGTYTWTGTNSAGCDSVVTLNLTITPQPEQPQLACWETATFNANTCAWVVSGTQPEQPTNLACYETAVFVDTLCNWVVTGTPAPAIVTNASACVSYTWEANGETYSTSGQYIFNSNCQEFVLNLTIDGQPEQPQLACWQTATFDAASCSWVIAGTQPAEPTDLACWETATFNANACAWVVTGTQPEQPTSLACYETALFVDTLCNWAVTGTPAPAIVTNASACVSYTWEANGETYSTSGQYSFNSNCQEYTLNLTINQPSTSSVNATITEGETYNFNGQNLTNAGTYTATLQNVAGCDSVVTLNLEVLPAQTSCVIEASSQTVCAGGSIDLAIVENGFTPCAGNNSNTPAWELLIPANSFNGNEVNFDPATFDKANSKLYSVLKNGSVNRVYCFDLNSNQVSSLSSNGGPNELYEAVFDFTNQRLVANRVGRDAVFTLPLSGGTWNQIGTGGFDAESYGANTFWNPVTQKFSYFGGYGFFAMKNWIWENNGSGWQNTYANNNNCTPGKRGGQISFNASGDKIQIFSGQGSCDGNQFASSCSLGSPWATDVGVYCWFRDLWELDLNTLQFSNILPVNSQSISREGAFAYDYENDDFYIIGGFVPSGNYSTNVNNYGGSWSNEVLRFKRGEESGFNPIATSGLPPALADNTVGYGTAIFDANYNRIILARKDGIWALNLSNCDKNYSWSTGETTPSISVSPSETTTYSVTVTQGNQTCTSELTINVNQPSAVSETAAACNSYTWNGNTYTQSGTYTWTGTNAAGCDSVVTLNLTITPQPEQPQIACWQTANFNTTTCSWDVTGTQPAQPSGLACYETANFNSQTCAWEISGTPAPAIVTNASACVSYTWEANGETYSTTGQYSFNSNCQEYTLNLTINQPSISSVNATITEGESYSFNGQNLTTAGTYTATLQNAAGCDSVVTLNLTVNPAPVGGCYAASVVSFEQGTRRDGTPVSAVRSDANLALGMPEAVVNNVVNFVSLGFGGSLTLAFETPIANGPGADIRIDEATWGNKTCNNYPESADVFASQDGINFVYLGRVCQDAELDLGPLSWAQYVRIVDASDLLSFNADADGYDVNGVSCLNGAATSLNNDGLVACTLQEVVSYQPGTRKNGSAVGAPRNNAANALGMPQNNNTINFVALGFGGVLEARFDYVVFNQPGNELRVTETSFGNPSCNNYPEKARVSVSLDGNTWTELGEICQDGELDLGTLPYAQYIRIQDASPMSSNKFNGSADGFDVDAVVVLNNGCGNSSARLAQMDNTTTPDASLMVSAFPNPMEDYTIVNFEGLENDSEFNFQIVDAAGRVIRNNNTRISTANPTYLFDASELARGIYQVIIANENGSNIIRLVK